MNRRVQFIWLVETVIAAVLVSVLIIFACARGELEKPTRAGGPRTKLVRQSVQVTSYLQWQRSGFWKQEDTVKPFWLVVSSDPGLACPLFESVLREPQPREYFQCPTEWRIWRKP